MIVAKRLRTLHSGALGAALLLGLAACSGSAAPGANPSPSSVPNRDATASTVTDSTTTTQLPEPGLAPFSDPGGTYSVAVGDNWVDNTGTNNPDVEAWVVPLSDGEIAIVSIATLNTSKPNVAAFLEDQVNLRAPNLVDLKYIQTQVIARPEGELGLIEYTGIGGGTPLHLLGFVSLKGTQAVVATATAPDESFDSMRLTVEPLLLTLIAT